MADTVHPHEVLERYPTLSHQKSLSERLQYEPLTEIISCSPRGTLYTQDLVPIKQLVVVHYHDSKFEPFYVAVTTKLTTHGHQFEVS